MTRTMSPRPPALHEIIDAAALHNLPPDNYFGQWEVYSHWQLESLKAIGLRPDHSLLDIGCGAMRLGLAALCYLDDGNYCGIDAFGPYIQLAHHLVRMANLKKAYSAIHDANFAFDRFGRTFDFAMAQSVFTHLSPKDIKRCMAALRPVMRPGGKFLFTYLFEATATVGFMYNGCQLMQRARIDSVAFFQDLGEKNGACFEPLTLRHPTQMVGLYTFLPEHAPGLKAGLTPNERRTPGSQGPS